MPILASPLGQLQALLWLVALHSLAVGVGLLLQPADLLARAGYAPVGEPYFPSQGGVFHVVMAVGVDGVMGVLILVAFRRWRRET